MVVYRLLGVIEENYMNIMKLNLNVSYGGSYGKICYFVIVEWDILVFRSWELKLFFFCRNVDFMVRICRVKRRNWLNMLFFILVIYNLLFLGIVIILYLV